MRTVGQALALLLCWAPGVAQQAVDTTASSFSQSAVIAAWEKALGGRQSLQQATTIHLLGTVTTGGLKGSFERWVTARGAMRTVIDLEGAFRRTVVFDGHRAWMQDKAVAVHELSGELLQNIVSSAYDESNSVFFSDRMHGEISLAGRDSSGSLVFDLFPVDGARITVYLDGNSFLPAHEETTGSMGRRIVTLADWREYSGVKFATSIRQSNGDPRFDSVITINRIEINRDPPPGTFAEPPSIAEPVQFSGKEHSVVVAAEVYGDHIFVPVGVNGSDPRWLIVDSGAATSVISESFAQKAGVQPKGNVLGQGTGAGSAKLALARDVRFDLIGISIPMSTITVWDFSTLLPALGRSWDGLLGFDVLSRVTVRVDYDQHQVTFIDPSTFVPGANAAILPVKFLGNLPVVRGTILLAGREPVETNLAIDSGADGLNLTTPFTKQNRVLEAIPRRIASSATGAGGHSSTWNGRLSGLLLGPYLLRGPIAGFSETEHEGLLASADLGALVGGEILQRFTVTFDFPHERILLEPNSHFSSPFVTNESGLGLIAVGDDFRRFVVDDVEPGSPAARSGVRKGDIVASVNGRSARELDLSAINGLLQAKHVAHIKVQRNRFTLELRIAVPERM